MRKLLALVALALSLTLIHAPGARAQVAVDDTVLLDPFDPVPEIQFRHFGDNGCWDSCGGYDRCHSGCGYHHCYSGCGERHCYRDCYADRHCEHGCRNWRRCDGDCWRGIGCERDCWDDGDHERRLAHEDEIYRHDHNRFRHDEERFREDTDVYEQQAEDYENRYV
ncbi:MAG TPA: hypothetical protein VFV07_07900, partial [Rhizomicrobium sp.]|nr:hypothetical protein [Rhizomicrobium sp.]